MSKKRRLLRRCRWFLLILGIAVFLTTVIRIWGKNGQDEEQHDTQDGALVILETITDLADAMFRKLGRDALGKQSVIMDIIAGSEPVFFEAESVGSIESTLPFLLSEGNPSSDQLYLEGMEAENQAYRERKAEEEQKKQEEQEEQEDSPKEESFPLPEEEEFIPPGEKSQFFDWESYADMEKLLEDFYTVDPTTEATRELFQVENLLNTDCTIDKNAPGPQILLYHTHSQEAFADSTPGNMAEGIVGAGEILASLLESYGYKVLHHKGQYDVESRDQAYNVALPEIEKLLEQNPGIQVVLDLHRDAVGEDTRLVSTVGGRTVAKVMFFNGLSRTRQQGVVSYLENPYLQENLAFSFQMKVLCDEYYPGFARDIYLRAYRYNMHLRPKTLLIELGAQTNTMEEIHHALEPLAHVLNEVLGG